MYMVERAGKLRSLRETRDNLLDKVIRQRFQMEKRLVTKSKEDGGTLVSEHPYTALTQEQEIKQD